MNNINKSQQIFMPSPNKSILKGEDNKLKEKNTSNGKQFLVSFISGGISGM